MTLVTPKDYTCGFRITLEETQDSMRLELVKMLEDRTQAAQESLAQLLWEDINGVRHPPLVGRFRVWLGQKLWSLARSINPECGR